MLQCFRSSCISINVIEPCVVIFLSSIRHTLGAKKSHGPKCWQPSQSSLNGHPTMCWHSGETSWRQKINEGERQVMLLLLLHANEQWCYWAREQVVVVTNRCKLTTSSLRHVYWIATFRTHRCLLMFQKIVWSVWDWNSVFERLPQKCANIFQAILKTVFYHHNIQNIYGIRQPTPFRRCTLIHDPYHTSESIFVLANTVCFPQSGSLL